MQANESSLVPSEPPGQQNISHINPLPAGANAAAATPETDESPSSNLQSAPAISMRKRGRKKKWFMEELFTFQLLVDSERDKACLSCRGCKKTFVSITPNATLLGQHLLRCEFTTPEAKRRLLLEPALQRYYREKLGSNAECFGNPLTPLHPAKKKRVSRVGSSASTARHGASNSKERISIVGESNATVQDSLDSYQKRTELVNLVTRFVVNHMLPFSLLSRKEGFDEFFQICRLLNPTLALEVPTVSQMSEKHIESYYRTMLDGVKDALRFGLLHAFGTLIFDGWTDINNETVVNVLLSITGTEKSRRTFLLRSIYSGSESCTSEFYARIVAEAMEGFGGMDRICGVVSDNTSSCVKAKRILAERFDHLTPCQDQTHLANLLMQDIGRLPWITEVLTTVADAVTELRNHPKLYSRFKTLKDKHNAMLMNAGYSPKTRDYDIYGRTKVSRYAILPTRMAPTRFASSESMLSSFIRAKEVLRKLVECECFHSTLWGPRMREKRSLFESTVTNDALFVKCADIYYILRPLRQYLRIFDDESSVVSEVYMATRELEQKLSDLPVTGFFTVVRKQEVLKLFKEREQGSSRRRSLLCSMHYVSYLLDVRSYREDLNDFREHIITHLRKFACSAVFPTAEKQTTVHGVDRAVRRIYQEFSCLRLKWQSLSENQNGSELFFLYANTPIVYWIHYKPKSSLLREFALRMLCVSPSSSSVERSFSMQAKIRTKTRNRLLLGKVQKMIFCSFNRLLFIPQQEKKVEDREYSFLNRAEQEVSSDANHAPTSLGASFLDLNDDGDAEADAEEPAEEYDWEDILAAQEEMPSIDEMTVVTEV